MSLHVAIENLRQLSEPVPDLLRLPTEAEVATAEYTLGVQFPPDYRYFLLHASDVVYGTIEPGVVIPDSGHLDLVKLVQNAWEIGVPKDYLPFCEDVGDHYCVTPNDHVVLWSKDGLSSRRWPDLAQWIQEIWIERGTAGFA